jgi:signal transduction histidine kinase
MEGVITNLDVLSGAPSILEENVQGSIPLFTAARSSTNDFSSSYFWVNRDGVLLWADAFTNSTIEQQYNGDDRSFRQYYQVPKETLQPYYSTVVESVDGVPRLYVAYPILDRQDDAQPSDDGIVFEGVVVSAIDLDDLGLFLQGQLHPKYSSTTGLIDRNGIILYTSNSTNIGKDLFGDEIQSLLPLEIKDEFNSFLRDSLKGEPGSGELSYQGNTSTIAYQPVAIHGNDLAILYITVPHQLTGHVSLLVDQQRTFNTIMIAVIGVVATSVAILVFLWNRRLSSTVDLRTSELKSANESLVHSNRQLGNVNQQLVDANKQLQLNEKMQREFINIAAHELRTPTQAILGYSDLFEIDPDSRMESMKAVSRNALRLERLTQDILDVSRIEGKALDLHKERFDIAEVIQPAIEDAKRQPINGDIKFVYQDGDGIIVEGDKVRITQVLSNLLNNAIKFTKKGTITVRTERDKTAGRVRVSVTDDGEGIHQDIEPRLFTKFTTNSQTGTGLGLFISKSIVEAHGGTINGRNNDGKGAVFSFTLPLN